MSADLDWLGIQHMSEEEVSKAVTDLQVKMAEAYNGVPMGIILGAFATGLADQAVDGRHLAALLHVVIGTASEYFEQTQAEIVAARPDNERELPT